ncbi:alpha-(1,6)-fucosyltransferase [Procambarus clarkii]|uniref:alpha-(1,6)-fucosyltransferase n=1 Tax=Procambarus clarkii TaxID=6728 RepID=UPI00374224AD
MPRQLLVVVLVAGMLLLLSLQDFTMSSGGYWHFRSVIPQDAANQNITRVQGYGRASSNSSSAWVPSLEFEVIRRMVETNLRGTWYFFADLLKEIYSSTDKMKEEDFKSRLKEGGERISVLQHDLKKLSKMDGADAWRERELQELSDLVQHRLHRLQNPSNCTAAKKFLCYMFACGMGCELHHIIFCFMAAYGDNRITIPNPGWLYTRNGWVDVIVPLSETCTNFSRQNMTSWPGRNDSETIVFPGLFANPKPHHVPLAVPRDISDRLIHLVGDPAAWWVGQFIKYVFKFQPYMQEIFKTAEKAVHFQHPIVGVQVRRTDKKREAPYRELSEYMEQVEEYFNGLQILDPNITRRIYLASDEPEVYKEAHEKYPQYEIVFHKKTIDVVLDANRFTPTSLRDLLVDMYFLARCDYIVVTFSSNIGRLAYEWMHALRSDASSRYYSLDHTFWYFSQREGSAKARFHHKFPGGKEESIRPGDQLQIPVISDYRRNMYMAAVKRQNKNLLMPAHKLQHVVEIVNISRTNWD